MGFEEEFLRYLQSLLSDVDRRIRRGHSRLTTTQELMKVCVCFGRFSLVQSSSISSHRHYLQTHL